MENNELETLAQITSPELETSDFLASVSPRYGRVKGASWFPLLFGKDVLVLGQGGIGSWVSALLSRVGCNLYLFDMDTYEAHNMSGQFVSIQFLGVNKAEAIEQMLMEFSPGCNVESYGIYNTNSVSGNIVICGFDNMRARKIAFHNWLESMKQDIHDVGANSRDYFFQDGRLLAEHLQIFNIRGDDDKSIEEYQKKYLFEDEEVQEAECTFKQTSHCAAMIASHMVGFLTNWASNVDRLDKGQKAFRSVPFFYEYLIPTNTVT